MHVPHKILLPLACALLAACSASSEHTADARVQIPGLPPGATFLTDDPTCTAPRCFELAVPLPEGVKVTENRVRVILPEGYEQSDERYPVIYLLHDAPGNYKSFTQRGETQTLTRGFDVIAVMPDGGGGNPGWYSDWLSGEFQWETYHINVLIPYIDEQLRTLGDGHRAVAGPSMGGFGSMSYSARHPGLFQAAAAFSGAVDFLAVDRGSALVGYLLNPVTGTPNEPIWGNPLMTFDVWQAHDPGTNVAGLAGMQILLASGNGLPGGAHDNLAQPQYYSIEPLIQIMNTSFAQTLADAGVEHRTWFYGPGFHDWPYYRDDLAWALPQLVAAITP